MTALGKVWYDMYTPHVTGFARDKYEKLTFKYFEYWGIKILENFQVLGILYINYVCLISSKLVDILACLRSCWETQVVAGEGGGEAGPEAQVTRK